MWADETLRSRHFEQELILFGKAFRPADLDAWGDVDRAPSQPGRSLCGDQQWRRVAKELRHIDPIERKVLVLSFARGLTLKEIGALLGLSPRTVDSHRARVRAKTGKKSLAELVRYALERDLL